MLLLFKNHKYNNNCILIMKTISLGLILTFILPFMTWAFELKTFGQLLPDYNKITHQGKLLTIPEKFGEIQSGFQGQDKSVILIQDLHCNAEVQQNIASIINHLVKEQNLKLVGEEGAYDFVDTSPISAFPIKAIREQISNYFVKQGMITGAEHADIINPKAIELVGIENAALYDASKKVVKGFLNNESLGYVFDLRDQLQLLKTQLYTPALSAYDQQFQDYQEGRKQLIVFAKYLNKTMKHLGIDGTAFESFNKSISFSQIIKNKAIDFDELSRNIQLIDLAIRKKLYTSDQQVELDNMITRLDTMERLLNISATQEELHTFRNNRDNYSINSFFDYFRRVEVYCHTSLQLELEIYTLDHYLTQVEKFYQLADHRSEAFINNIINHMDQTDESIAIMTHGGFHSDDLMVDLKARGIGYLSIRPNVTNLDVVNPYFEFLQGKKTSLEKLLTKNQDIMAIFTRFARPESKRIFSLLVMTLAQKILSNKQTTPEELTQVLEFVENQKIELLKPLSDSDKKDFPVLKDCDYFWIDKDNQIPLIRVTNQHFTQSFRDQLINTSLIELKDDDIIVFSSLPKMKAGIKKISELQDNQSSYWEETGARFKQGINSIFTESRMDLIRKIIIDPLIETTLFTLPAGLAIQYGILIGNPYLAITGIIYAALGIATYYIILQSNAIRKNWKISFREAFLQVWQDEEVQNRFRKLALGGFIFALPFTLLPSEPTMDLAFFSFIIHILNNSLKGFDFLPKDWIYASESTAVKGGDAGQSSLKRLLTDLLKLPSEQAAQFQVFTQNLIDYEATINQYLESRDYDQAGELLLAGMQNEVLNIHFEDLEFMLETMAKASQWSWIDRLLIQAIEQQSILISSKQLSPWLKLLQEKNQPQLVITLLQSMVQHHMPGMTGELLIAHIRWLHNNGRVKTGAQLLHLALNNDGIIFEAQQVKSVIEVIADKSNAEDLIVLHGRLLEKRIIPKDDDWQQARVDHYQSNDNEAVAAGLKLLLHYDTDTLAAAFNQKIQGWITTNLLDASILAISAHHLGIDVNQSITTCLEYGIKQGAGGLVGNLAAETINPKLQLPKGYTIEGLVDFVFENAYSGYGGELVVRVLGQKMEVSTNVVTSWIDRCLNDEVLVSFAGEMSVLAVKHYSEVGIDKIERWINRFDLLKSEYASSLYRAALEKQKISKKVYRRLYELYLDQDRFENKVRFLRSGLENDFISLFEIEQLQLSRRAIYTQSVPFLGLAISSFIQRKSGLTNMLGYINWKNILRIGYILKFVKYAGQQDSHIKNVILEFIIENYEQFINVTPLKYMLPIPMHENATEENMVISSSMACVGSLFSDVNGSAIKGEELNRFILGTPGAEDLLNSFITISEKASTEIERIMIRFKKNPDQISIMTVAGLLLENKVPAKYILEISRIMSVYTFLYACEKLYPQATIGVYGSATRAGEWPKDIDFAISIANVRPSDNVIVDIGLECERRGIEANLIMKNTVLSAYKDFDLLISVIKMTTDVMTVGIIKQMRLLTGSKYKWKPILAFNRKKYPQQLKILFKNDMEHLFRKRDSTTNPKIGLRLMNNFAFHVSEKYGYDTYSKKMVFEKLKHENLITEKEIIRVSHALDILQQSRLFLAYQDTLKDTASPYVLNNIPTEESIMRSNELIIQILKKMALEIWPNDIKEYADELTRKEQMALNGHAIRPFQAGLAFLLSWLAIPVLALIGDISGVDSLWVTSAGLLFVMGFNWLASLLGKILPARAGPQEKADPETLIPFLQQVDPGDVKFIEWITQKDGERILTMNNSVYHWLANSHKIIQRLFLYPLGIIGHETYHQLFPKASEKRTYTITQILPTVVGSTLFGGIAIWLGGSTLLIAMGNLAGAITMVIGVGYIITWQLKGSTFRLDKSLQQQMQKELLDRYTNSNYIEGHLGDETVILNNLKHPDKKIWLKQKTTLLGADNTMTYYLYDQQPRDHVNQWIGHLTIAINNEEEIELLDITTSALSERQGGGVGDSIINWLRQEAIVGEKTIRFSNVKASKLRKLLGKYFKNIYLTEYANGYITQGAQSWSMQPAHWDQWELKEQEFDDLDGIVDSVINEIKRKKIGGNFIAMPKNSPQVANDQLELWQLMEQKLIERTELDHLDSKKKRQLGRRLARVSYSTWTQEKDIRQVYLARLTSILSVGLSSATFDNLDQVKLKIAEVVNGYEYLIYPKDVEELAEYAFKVMNAPNKISQGIQYLKKWWSTIISWIGIIINWLRNKITNQPYFEGQYTEQEFEDYFKNYLNENAVKLTGNRMERAEIDLLSEDLIPTFPPAVKYWLLRYPQQLQPVFLELLNEKSEQTGPIDVVDENELNKLSMTMADGEVAKGKLLLEQVRGFRVPINSARKKQKSGIKIVAALVDVEGSYWDFQHSFGRQPFFPLNDMTILGIKGGGQSQDLKVSGMKIAQRYGGISYGHELEKGLTAFKKLRKYFSTLNDSIMPFPSLVGHTQLYKVPTETEKYETMNEIDYPSVTHHLIFYHHQHAMRFNKYPNWWVNNNGLLKICEDLTYILKKNYPDIAKGKISLKNLFHYIFWHLGLALAAMVNNGLVYATIHSQDMGFELADLEELLDISEELQEIRAVNDNKKMVKYYTQILLPIIRVMSLLLTHSQKNNKDEKLYTQSINKAIVSFGNAFFGNLEPEIVKELKDKNYSVANKVLDSIASQNIDIQSYGPIIDQLRETMNQSFQQSADGKQLLKFSWKQRESSIDKEPNLKAAAIEPSQAFIAFSFSWLAIPVLALIGAISGVDSLWITSAGVVFLMLVNWLVSMVGKILPKRDGPQEKANPDTLIPFLQQVMPGQVAKSDDDKQQSGPHDVKFIEWVILEDGSRVLTMNSAVYHFLSQRSKLIQRLFLYPLGIVGHETYHQLFPKASEKRTYTITQILPTTLGSFLFGSVLLWLTSSVILIILGSIAGAVAVVSGYSYWLINTQIIHNWWSKVSRSIIRRIYRIRNQLMNRPYFEGQYTEEEFEDYFKNYLINNGLQLIGRTMEAQEVEDYFEALVPTFPPATKYWLLRYPKVIQPVFMEVFDAKDNHTGPIQRVDRKALRSLSMTMPSGKRVTGQRLLQNISSFRVPINNAIERQQAGKTIIAGLVDVKGKHWIINESFGRQPFWPLDDGTIVLAKGVGQTQDLKITGVNRHSKFNGLYNRNEYLRLIDAYKGIKKWFQGSKHIVMPFSQCLAYQDLYHAPNNGRDYQSLDDVSTVSKEHYIAFFHQSHPFRFNAYKRWMSDEYNISKIQEDMVRVLKSQYPGIAKDNLSTKELFHFSFWHLGLALAHVYNEEIKLISFHPQDLGLGFKSDLDAHNIPQQESHQNRESQSDFVKSKYYNEILYNILFVLNGMKEDIEEKTKHKVTSINHVTPEVYQAGLQAFCHGCFGNLDTEQFDEIEIAIRFYMGYMEERIPEDLQYNLLEQLKIIKQQRQEGRQFKFDWPIDSDNNIKNSSNESIGNKLIRLRYVINVLVTIFNWITKSITSFGEQPQFHYGQEIFNDPKHKLKYYAEERNESIVITATHKNKLFGEVILGRSIGDRSGLTSTIQPEYDSMLKLFNINIAPGKKHIKIDGISYASRLMAATLNYAKHNLNKDWIITSGLLSDTVDSWKGMSKHFHIEGKIAPMQQLLISTTIKNPELIIESDDDQDPPTGRTGQSMDSVESQSSDSSMRFTPTFQRHANETPYDAIIQVLEKYGTRILGAFELSNENNIIYQPGKTIAIDIHGTDQLMIQMPKWAFDLMANKSTNFISVLGRGLIKSWLQLSLRIYQIKMWFKPAPVWAHLKAVNQVPNKLESQLASNISSIVDNLGNRDFYNGLNDQDKSVYDALQAIMNNNTSMNRERLILRLWNLMPQNRSGKDFLADLYYISGLAQNIGKYEMKSRIIDNKSLSLPPLKLPQQLIGRKFIRGVIHHRIGDLVPVLLEKPKRSPIIEKRTIFENAA